MSWGQLAGECWLWVFHYPELWSAIRGRKVVALRMQLDIMHRADPRIIRPTYVGAGYRRIDQRSPSAALAVTL